MRGIITIVFLHLFALEVIAEENCEKLVCIPTNYDKSLTPQSFNPVNISISSIEILKVNDYDCTVTVTSYLEATWIEPRLIVPNVSLQYKALGRTFLDELWLPDITLYHQKTLNKIGLMHDLSQSGGLTLLKNNYLLYDVLFEAEIYCKMRFESYPLDSHVCTLLLSSWNYDEEVLNLTIQRLDFDADDQVSLLDYKPEVRSLPESKQRRFYHDSYWSSAGFEIVLHRNIHKYIANYYIPSGFLVLVSWISFLIPSDAIPGRMALLIILTLTVMNIMIGVIDKSPNTESLTSISSWMISCFVFIQAALFEYASILFIKHIWPEFNVQSLKIVDTWSMVVSMISFIAFNIVFWSTQTF